MKNFTCISVNHKLCGQAFRSLFTFDSAQCEKLLFDVKDLSPVLICTCNRTELYSPFINHLLQHTSEVHMIFQGAIACAKKINTETELSKTSVSTATLAAKEAAHYKDNVRVMLLGASGEIGSLVLKNLLSYKNVTVLATARSHRNALEYISDDPKLELIPYEKRYERIGECDCIISATSSPHYTVTADMLNDNENKLFIDLAVRY